MADLPEERLTKSPPFTFVHVDVFGPWEVSTRCTRGGSAKSKRLAVLFTCLYCRAIHIEVIKEMSSSSFVNAMRHFIAIWGKVSEFRSDCGTNFVGTVSELGMNAVYVGDNHVKPFLDNNKIVWRFNPPHASHFGGIWERMIGVARRVLDAMLLDFKHRSTHEVLTFLVSEVMAIINSWPLVAVSADADTPFVLFPQRLLTQKTSDVPLEFVDMEVVDTYRSQWKTVQVMSNTFWKQWKGDFLSALQSCKKWHTPMLNLQVGDVILLWEKELAHNDWPIGLVVCVFPSESDGLVCKLEVRIIKNGKPCLFIRHSTEVISLLPFLE